MKQVSVDNLKENDILAFPILSHSGTVLIHADVALTEELIERAINLGVRTVYIKDEKEGIVREYLIVIRHGKRKNIHTDLKKLPIIQGR